VAAGDSASAVASATYTVTPVTTTPTFSPAAGTYAVAQTVSIKDATSGASIYYTTNGSTPTTSSTKYSAPIPVKNSEKIEAIAIAPGDVRSGVISASYNIDVKWTESILVSFNGANGDTPWAGLVIDGAGNLYGTTSLGGTNNTGTVFKISPSGTESVLHSFAVPGETDGDGPYAGLVMDSAGNLYGTTAGGGTNGTGTVFKISPSGAESVIYSFAAPGGTGPLSPYFASLLMDSAGNLYGTTASGGTNDTGTVFKLSASGTESVLHSFGPYNGTDGDAPDAGLVMDRDGNLYGTTTGGGPYQTGTVFKINTSGAESVLYSFSYFGGPDGVRPYGGLIMDSDGTLYGTTNEGGTNKTGTVFKISASGAESVLYSFGVPGGLDAYSPEFESLVMDGAGNLYGTTASGGTNNTGTVFKISTSGVESVLYSFGSSSGTDGDSPYAGLIMDTAGNLYGTTRVGGAFGRGIVFKLSP
jgi:uncharacterized repeat protein (TIGR03803 family)